MAWQVPKMWEGGECWIIGGGHSIPEIFGVPQSIIDEVNNKKLTPAAFTPYLSPIHNKHVIGINAAYLLGNWIDILFFGDFKFFQNNQEGLSNYKGLLVGCHKRVNQFEGIKHMGRDNNHPFGISTRKGFVSWNVNSGAASISLAVQLGVKKIYLLGFDMNAQGDNRHWHKEYQYKAKKLPYDRHLKGFTHIAIEAKSLGVEIINVNPNSAIDTLPKKTLNECL
jgi:hypothetical protein